jgi:hypothetical protein
LAISFRKGRRRNRTYPPISSRLQVVGQVHHSE